MPMKIISKHVSGVKCRQQVIYELGIWLRLTFSDQVLHWRIWLLQKLTLPLARLVKEPGGGD